jgi:Ala-tRNA(Pro) deacylase
MTIATTVQTLLNDRQIPYEVIAHPRTESSAETAAAAHVPDDHIAKGVVLKDGQGYLLVVIPASRWVELGRVREELNRSVEVAPETEAEQLFPDCQPGAVPPLGFAYGLTTLLDEALTTLAKVFFEAGDHEHLVAVTGEHFQTLLSGTRHGHFSSGD